LNDRIKAQWSFVTQARLDGAWARVKGVDDCCCVSLQNLRNRLESSSTVAVLGIRRGSVGEPSVTS
jgi:hypothetical protein